MKKQVPLEKQQKRAQKEHDRTQRGDWGTVKPVLRVVESKKRYSRKRLKDADASQRSDVE